MTRFDFKRHTFAALAGLVVATLAGCAVGPDYVRPVTQLPAVYPLAEGGAVSVEREWWRAFGDARLDTLVELALKNNGDLRVAMARVMEAQAFAREVSGALLPEIDLEATGKNTKTSSKASQLNANNLRPEVRTAALVTSYELDIWGRSRRASESARAKLLASRYGFDAMSLSVASIVVNQYLALRALDAQIVLTEDSRAAQKTTRDLIEKRLAAGLSSALDLARADAALAGLDAQRASLREQRATRESQLGLLVGDPGLTLPVLDQRVLPRPPLPPAGLPADLIESRPDVRAAEEALVAANAGVGLAKAAYFPRLTLTGRLGFESQDLGDLLKAGTSTGSLGLSALFPLLDFGKTSAQVDQARARHQQQWAQYETTLRVAFKEVRDALVALRERASAEQANEIRFQRATEAQALANKRFEAGYSSYLDVLDAQRVANDAGLALSEARRASGSAAVDFFKALGGGWRAVE